MTLNDYQTQAMQTRMETCNNFDYMTLNLVGEVGEFTSKVAKLIRKGQATINNNQLQFILTPESDPNTMEALKYELGDIMWQVAGLCDQLGFSLEEVCQANLNKLSSRQKRGVIDGNGDYR